MKLVSFDYRGDSRLGITINNRILNLYETCRASGLARKECAAVKNMSAYLASGDAGFEIASRMAGKALSDPESCVWTDRPILAPVPNPPKLLLLAGNYAEHIAEEGGQAPGKGTMTPRVFMKPPSTTVTAPNCPIVIPPNAGFIDWEAELAVVMGKRGKFIPVQNAYEFVAGYTILNDISERELRIETDRTPRPGDNWFDWLNGKWLDTFAPMGPCLVTRDEIPDPHSLTIRLKVNGVIKQNSSTANMIFTVPEIIAFISRYVTLEPGDVISTGTPAGIGHARGEALQDGDVVTIEIEKIGALTNPVKRVPAY